MQLLMKGWYNNAIKDVYECAWFLQWYLWCFNASRGAEYDSPWQYQYHCDYGQRIVIERIRLCYKILVSEMGSDVFIDILVLMAGIDKSKYPTRNSDTAIVQEIHLLWVSLSAVPIVISTPEIANLVRIHAAIVLSAAK